MAVMLVAVAVLVAVVVVAIDTNGLQFVKMQLLMQLVVLMATRVWIDVMMIGK